MPAPSIGQHFQHTNPELKPPRGWLETLLADVENVRFRDTTGTSNNSYFLVTELNDDDTLTVASGDPEGAVEVIGAALGALHLGAAGLHGQRV